MAAQGFASPVTTSAGRLFDAVAALCGVRALVNYEGQAAVELEGAATRAGLCVGYPLPLAAPPAQGSEEGPGPPAQAAPFVLDARPTILAVAADVAAGVHVPTIAARFHAAVARATADACARAAGERGLDSAVLSGGVFQNRLLLAATADALAAAGMRVLTPERLPPNDGGVSYGQVAVAAAR
jgi:hydrogenase maturation protein HypF